MKRFYLALLCVLFLILVMGGAASHRIPEGCREYYRPDKIVSVGDRAIKAEVADSEKEQEQGLSGRACIGENQGMLFVFSEPGYYNFWMKDMNFPIDIVWIDSDKKVIEVTDNIQPSTYPDTFTSGRQPQYVLELKAGHASELGITSGSRLSF